MTKEHGLLEEKESKTLFFFFKPPLGSSYETKPKKTWYVQFNKISKAYNSQHIVKCLSSL